jgi:hypothetical protein
VRQQILDEIRRIADELGRVPGKRTFERETGIRESAWSGVYWARWGAAVEEAGLAVNTIQHRLDDAVMFERMAKIMRHFGKVPTEPELRLYNRGDDDSLNSRTIRKKFGGKPQFLERLREYAKTDHELADIIAMLPNEAPGRTAPSPRELKEGYVYLIRSGAFYKIGMSSEIERRVKEIRVAQPEKSDLVHVIRTDDPSGIEAYWHKRFADRRANGEWFRLTTHDVAAFKRRKFQ